MSSYVVYIHTSPSMKRYVGITSQDVEKRWQNGHGYRHNTYFVKAINKYGWNNFGHYIVASGLTKLEAEGIEKSLIEKYQTNDKCFGYNIKSGGDSNGKHSETSKHLMSVNRKGKGTQPKSEATKQKMRENHAGGNAPKQVVCIETGEIFKSINEAARVKGLNKKVISNCCRGIIHYNTAGGCHWQFL